MRDAPAIRLEALRRRTELVSAAVATMALACLGIIGVSRTPPDPATTTPRHGFRPLVADQRGTVELKVRPALDDRWIPLPWSHTFEEGDWLRTGASSHCDVMLSWRTGVRIMPGSELRWRRVSRRGELRDIEVELRRGRLLASLDELPEGSRFEVTTPHTRARVKGTVLSVSVDDEGSTVTVHSGVVEVSDQSDPTRRTTADAGTRVESKDVRPRPLSREERAAILAELTALDGRLHQLAGSRAPSSDTTDTPPPPPASAARRSSSSPAPSPGGEEAPTPGVPATDLAAAEEVEELIRSGLSLLDRGLVAQALERCSPTFRALLDGPLVERAGVPTDVSRDAAAAAAARLAESLLLRFEPVEVDVTIDGDVAHAAALIDVIATPIGSDASVVQRYHCSARCLRQADGRWWIDLATATEARR